MYINQFELSGTPVFYSKGTEGNGEFYTIEGVLAYFPYPQPPSRKVRSVRGTDHVSGSVSANELTQKDAKHREAVQQQDTEPQIPLPTDAAGAFLPITAKGFFHSEEYEDTIECCDCGNTFPKTLGLSYLTVTSFRTYEPPVCLGTETPPAVCHGTVIGDVQSVREVEGRERPFHMARLAIKDTTTPVGFSYLTVSSLHPFTVDKGDYLCSRGRLVATKQCLNPVCPACGSVNSFLVDSLILRAAAVQSLNTPRGYFGDKSIS